MLSVYEPNNCLKRNRLTLWREIFSDLHRNSWLTYQLFRRDFFSLYKQSVFGVFWSVFSPIIGVATFIILKKSGILSVGTVTVPYPLWAILGLALWQIFSTGVIATSNSLVKAGPMIVKVNFSKKSLVVASIGQALISFLVQMVFVIVLLFFYRLFPDIRSMFLVLMVIPILFLTLGLGFVLSIVNGVIRDVSSVLSVAMTFLLFLTPVLYVKPETGILAKISRYNPLYYLVAVPRDIVFSGTTVEWTGYLLSSLLAALFCFLTLYFFHLAEPRIAERI